MHNFQKKKNLFRRVNNLDNVEYTAKCLDVLYKTNKLRDIIHMIMPHFELYPLQSFSKHVFSKPLYEINFLI